MEERLHFIVDLMMILTRRRAEADDLKERKGARAHILVTGEFMYSLMFVDCMTAVYQRQA